MKDELGCAVILVALGILYFLICLGNAVTR
jgi:hypothetical protein